MIKNILKRKIIHGFDQWSNSYSLDVEPKLKKRGYSYERLAENIVQFLNPVKGAVVAELGTGAGILGASIKKIRPDLNLYGFDISSKMLKEAARNPVYTCLFRCDAEKIPFQSDYFDYVFTSFMFHSILNAKNGLFELKRIISPLGRIILVDLFRSKNKIPYISNLLDNMHSLKYEFGAPSNYHGVDEFIKKITAAELYVSRNIKLDNKNTGYNPVGGMVHHLLELSKVKRKAHA